MSHKVLRLRKRRSGDFNKQDTERQGELNAAYMRCKLRCQLTTLIYITIIDKLLKSFSSWESAFSFPMVIDFDYQQMFVQ